MAGELVPVVMVPRFTAYTSTAEFMTIAMDVTPFQKAIINAWRTAIGDSGGGTPTYKMWFEESTDQINWMTCDGTNAAGQDPGVMTEEQFEATLRRRWFRIRIQMTGTNPMVTCWAVGFLEERER